MKKSLNSILVIVLTIIGLKGVADKVDINANRTIKESTDGTGVGNGSGVRNAITKDT